MRHVTNCPYARSSLTTMSSQRDAYQFFCTTAALHNFTDLTRYHWREMENQIKHTPLSEQQIPFGPFKDTCVAELHTLRAMKTSSVVYYSSNNNSFRRTRCEDITHNSCRICGRNFHIHRKSHTVSACG